MSVNRRTALVTFLALVAGFTLIVVYQHRWSGEAFSAFYCGGEAVAHGANPYRIEPLRSCEHRVAPQTNPPDVVEPAPLPGYALVAFAALARLPYRPAALVFVAASLASVAIAAVALSELTGLPLVAPLGALLVVDGFVNVSYGEIPPLAIAALCVAGVYAARGRDRLAALAASAAMIEPHLGLAACLSLMWRPRARIVLAGAAILFGALWIVFLSLPNLPEYFTQVIPLQSRAEVPAADQYSLTWLAHLAGADDVLASQLGSLSYIALLFFGVLAAPRVARKLHAPALLVFFPVAATTLFGVFIHDLQLPAAVPAALVIAVALGASGRGVWFAMVVVSLEWVTWWETDRVVVVLSIFSVAAIAWAAMRERAPRERLTLACLAPIAYLLVLAVYVHLPHTAILTGAEPWPSRAALVPSAQAALNWGALIRGSSEASDATVQLLIGKLIVWAALASVLVQGIRTSRISRPPAPSRLAASLR